MHKAKTSQYKLYYSEKIDCYAIWQFVGRKANESKDPEIKNGYYMVHQFKNNARNSDLIRRLVNILKDRFKCTHIVPVPGSQLEESELQKLFGSQVIRRTEPVKARKHSRGSDITEQWKKSLKINWTKLNRESRILLVDDTAATGQTIRTVAGLLGEKGHEVVCLALGINPELIELEKHELLSIEPEKAIKAAEPPKLIQQMDNRELEAFELYYALGENRNIYRMVTTYPEKKFNRTTLTRWSLKYNWPKMVEERDRAVVKQIAETAVKTIAEEKAEAIQTTGELIKMVEAVISTGFIRNEDGTITPRFTVNSVKELKEATQSFIELTKLKLQLFGEEIDKDESKTINLQIVQNNQIVEEHRIEVNNKTEDAEYSEIEE